MWKKRFLCLLTVLALAASGGEIAAARPNVLQAGTQEEGRCDGYTNDSYISASKYTKNIDKYHSIFRMNLAGPGLTAWDYATGKGVNVAVFDIGADVSYADLKGNIKGCYNAITKKEGSANIANESHGTSTSKILAAVGNNKRESAGVAWQANLYIVQVDEKEGSTHSQFRDAIIEGIRWAVSKNCRVISMSLSETDYDAEMEQAINEIYSMTKNSVLFVASAGNTDNEQYRYPSSYSNVMSVSALNYSSKTKQYTISNSTSNDRIDIAAPGGKTSAAAPYAAGVAALIFQIDPSLTAGECANIITSTAMDVGSKGYDKRYGHGIIQPLAAVQKAKYKKSSITRKITGTSSYTKTYGAKAFTLNAKTSGSGVLKYQSSNAKVAAVNSRGKVTIKSTGKAAIKVTIPKSGIYKSASKTITITVKPKKPAPKAVNKSGKKLKVTWKKDTRATGYVIYVADNSKFKGQKTYTLKQKQTSGVISGLKKGKIYRVRMRSYKVSGGRRIYSDYSKTVKVKIKK